MKVPKDSSWTWRHVLQARTDARKLITYSIANGENTLLWHDLWCGDSPLLENPLAVAEWQFPLDTKVSHIIENGVWADAVHNIQSSQLKELILGVCINRNLDQDRVIWMSHQSGQFTSNSAYMTLRSVSPKVKWSKVVWEKWVILKHSFTCWQLLSNSLSTQDRLIQKKILTQSSCCLCNRSREFSKHLFFECEYSKELFRSIKRLIGLTTDDRNSNCEWSSIIRLSQRSGPLAEVYKVYICAGVDAIWKERNARRFQNTRRPVAMVFGNLCRDLKSYLQVTLRDLIDSPDLRRIIASIGIHVQFKESVQKLYSWKCPEEGKVKLNADGSVAANGCGHGGVIRDEHGNVVSGYIGSGGPDSVLHQELKAIEVGIAHCASMQFKQVQVESDSKRAIQVINKFEKPPWYCEDIVKAIHNHVYAFEDVSFHHIFRECNRAAGYLAGLCQKSCTFCIYLSSPLDSHLSVIVEEDASGKLYNRV